MFFVIGPCFSPFSCLFALTLVVLLSGVVFVGGAILFGRVLYRCCFHFFLSKSQIRCWTP